MLNTHCMWIAESYHHSSKERLQWIQTTCMDWPLWPKHKNCVWVPVSSHPLILGIIEGLRLKRAVKRLRVISRKQSLKIYVPVYGEVSKYSFAQNFLHTPAYRAKWKEVPFVGQSCVFVPFLHMETAEYPCGECANQVKDEDKAVYCEGQCESWFHAQCVNMDDEQYVH